MRQKPVSLHIHPELLAQFDEMKANLRPEVSRNVCIAEAMQLWIKKHERIRDRMAAAEPTGDNTAMAGFEAVQ